MKVLTRTRLGQLIIIYFRLFNNPVDTPQPVTVYNYAIHKTQILTTNRTDSLQIQSISAQRGLELDTSRSLCRMLSNAPRAPCFIKARYKFKLYCIIVVL